MLSTEADSILLDLKNSSHHTQPHPIIVEITVAKQLSNQRDLGPVYMEVGTPGRWGNPPIHIISHFNLVTFT